MNAKQKLAFYGILILTYLILTIPLLYISVLLGLRGDLFVVVFGIVNTFFALKFLKGNLILSVCLGFLISSISLCCLYFIWFFDFLPFQIIAYYPFLILIFYILFWLIITQNKWKLRNPNKALLLIYFATLFFFILSLSLKDVYPTKYENQNQILTEIQIVDKENKPRAGSSIEVRIDRYPLFALRESHLIYRTTTNKNGFAKIKLSKSNNYVLYVDGNEEVQFVSFDIDSTDLQNKKSFIIEQ